MLGFMQDCGSKLIVRMACGISRHQRWSEKSFWVMESPTMKFPLKVLIARSADFLRWMWGGNSRNFLFTSLIKQFRTFGPSFSRICRGGLKPLLVNKLWSFWCADVRSRPDLVLRVQRGLFLSRNGKRPGYTYCHCLMWMGTFLFDPYKFPRKDPLSLRRQDWCFMTVWLEGTGRALDLVLDAWPFIVLIRGPSAVAGGAQHTKNSTLIV